MNDNPQKSIPYPVRDMYTIDQPIEDEELDMDPEDLQEFQRQTSGSLT